MVEGKATAGSGRRAKPVLGAVFLLSTCLARPTVGQDKPVELGFEKGKLHELAGPISQLLKLARDGKTLRLDRRHWKKEFASDTDARALKKLEEELLKRGMSKEWAARHARRLLKSRPVELIFDKLQTAAGSSGGSASTSGDFFAKSFRGNGLTARIRISGASFYAVLEEENAPHRRLEFSDDGRGAMRLILADKSGKFVLAVIQNPQGRFSVAHIYGNDRRTEVAESFQEFYAKRRRYVDGTLFPLLAHVGMGLPWTPCHPKVEQAVLARLRGPLTQAEIRQAETLIRQLNHDVLERREQAAEALSTSFARYRDTIKNTMKDPSNPPEVASRLKRILDENAGQDGIEEFLDARKLAEDVGYLVELLQEVGPGDREAIVKTLQRITGQKLASDPAAWQEWWEQNSTDTQPASKPA